MTPSRAVAREPAGPELRGGALAALLITAPEDKQAAVRALASRMPEPDPAVEISEPPGVPGRPARPSLVRPRAVAQRSVANRQGRAALLHALAHIEFNAINLALDAVWRFAGMPREYYRDWMQVAAEEALHFGLLCDRLSTVDCVYGDFDGHDGLWEMARKTSDDVLARMALVPRTLEARGLDASPLVGAKLLQVGDTGSAAVIDRILRDEVGHVAIGNRWYRWSCKARGLDPIAAFETIARDRGAPRLRGPFNIEARLAAGFEEAELRALGAWPYGVTDSA